MIESNSIANSLVGQIFNDKYEIIDLIHKGGASTIYKVSHPVMDKTVAIKVMAPHLMADAISIKRFQQEAQAMSHLSHPATVTIFDYNITDSGPYLVMNYYEGTNMMSLVEKEGPLSVDRFRKLFFVLSETLSHVHKQGVIHRDLKPPHFLVSGYSPHNVDCLPVLKPGEEYPVLLDFRMAKLLPSSGKESQGLNDIGELIGTPLYMSPEQCMAQEADARSDIYSMGCSMYFALTGEPPFQGTSMIDTMQKHMSAQPNADRLPAEVREIVLKAMEKKPGDRFQSMDELANEIGRDAATKTEKRKSWWPF